MLDKSTMITLNRGCFDPAEFLVGGRIVQEETDARSAALTELDISKIKHVSMLSAGERSITGVEKLKRLKLSGKIRLDADIFYNLWKKPHLIPKEWEAEINGTTRFVHFFGTIIEVPDGRHFVMYLCYECGNWNIGRTEMKDGLYEDDPAAVLEI